MPQPIKVRGRFATVRDTVKVLGLSESHVRGLIDVVKRHTREDAGSNLRYRRSSRAGIVIPAKNKAGSKDAKVPTSKPKTEGSKAAR